MIHPTAIVESGAEIGSDVSIGPYSYIANDVFIGDGTTLGPHVVIEPYTSIGTNCQIYQFASLGAPPQAVKFAGEKTYVKIGSNCIIREFVTIHRGTTEDRGLTEVGDNCLLMAYTHVAHDCRIGNRVVFANNATLAGHITVGDNATIGGLVAIHQFVNIGEYAFIGGKSAVVKDIPPYVIAVGDRAKLYGLNSVGLKRHNFSQHSVSTLKKAYRIVFRIGLTLNEAIERVHAEVEQTPEVIHFLDFLKSSRRGITR